MSWTEERARYQAFAESVEPVAVVTSKDHWAWSALWWVGAVLTLGLLALGISRRRFLEDFGTTVVTRQGYPSRLESLSRRFVTHECRHTTQAVAFGWWLFPVAWASRRLRAWLGVLPNLLAYALLPLPVYLAAGRFYLELDADRAAWRRGLAERWLTPGEVRERAAERAETMSSGAYVWAWPRSWARSAYAKAAEKEIRASARTANGELG